MMYDHFIGDPNCIHIVVFSLMEPPNVQLDQVMFWLHFIKARIPAFEPIGKSKWFALGRFKQVLDSKDSLT